MDLLHVLVFRAVSNDQYVDATWTLLSLLPVSANPLLAMDTKLASGRVCWASYMDGTSLVGHSYRLERCSVLHELESSTLLRLCLGLCDKSSLPRD